MGAFTCISWLWDWSIAGFSHRREFIMTSFNFNKGVNENVSKLNLWIELTLFPMCLLRCIHGKLGVFQHIIKNLKLRLQINVIIIKCFHSRRKIITYIFSFWYSNYLLNTNLQSGTNCPVSNALGVSFDASYRFP